MIFGIVGLHKNFSSKFIYVEVGDDSNKSKLNLQRH
jgi:hypothetical protein